MEVVIVKLTLLQTSYCVILLHSGYTSTIYYFPDAKSYKFDDLMLLQCDECLQAVRDVGRILFQVNDACAPFKSNCFITIIAS